MIERYSDSIISQLSGFSDFTASVASAEGLDKCVGSLSPDKGRQNTRGSIEPGQGNLKNMYPLSLGFKTVIST